MNPEFIQQLVGYIIGGAAVYAAIKSDLTRAIVIAEKAAESAGLAHNRLDHHIENNH
jgi:hypothetical protein